MAIYGWSFFYFISFIDILCKKYSIVNCIINKILVKQKYYIMLYLKNFFAKFLLTNFASWSGVIFLILFVIALVCITIASKFDDPFEKGNKISATFGYTGIVAGVLSFILFIIIWFVEFVAVFVFLIRSQIAFPGFAMRLVTLLVIAFLFVYLLFKGKLSWW